MSWVDAVALAVAVACYAVSSLLLSDGSGRRDGAAAHPLRRRTWWLGVGFQAAAFAAAFVARRSLPLLVVQPAVAGSVAVTYALGVRLGRWPARPREIIGLAAVVVGVLGLALVALPTRSLAVPVRVQLLMWTIVLMIMLVVAAGPRLSARWHTMSASGRTRTRRTLPTNAVAVAWGALAGLAYGVGAVAARALAPGAPGSLLREPGTAALVVVATVVGQAVLIRALAGPVVAGPVAAMYVVASAGPAFAGVRWLGDEVVPGGGWIAGPAAVLALVGVAALARSTAAADESTSLPSDQLRGSRPQLPPRA